MGWEKVYCYAWNATKTTGEFPGVEMTGTTYKNEQNQTVDVTGFKNGTAYYLKKDKDKKGHCNVDTWTYTPSN